MGARPKNRRAPKSVRPKWWEYPTFATYGQNGDPGKSTGTVRVELILPDGSRVNLGQLPNPANNDALRRAVAERFKKIWDPAKRCRHSEQT
ncbi:MAG: hypothetical protein WC348_04005 [Patescibacteria group bacterium]